nr:GIY-YIG nuclease family protein [Halomonas jincaotanensis]
MSQGRSIRLFLVDGTPNGLLTAEIMNWTGHVLTGPRSKLSELVQRPECGRTGIYFLVGPDPENSLRPLVYIDDSDDVGTRLKQHNRPEAVSGSGDGKDFWEKVCLITSKDQNLTKAHVKYLESLLIQNAGQVGRCKLINGTAHDYINLPESDRADMAFFVEQIRTVLPVLGLDFLRETSRPSRLPRVCRRRPSSPPDLGDDLAGFLAQRRLLEAETGVEVPGDLVGGHIADRDPLEGALCPNLVQHALHGPVPDASSLMASIDHETEDVVGRRPVVVVEGFVHEKADRFPVAIDGARLIGRMEARFGNGVQIVSDIVTL